MPVPLRATHHRAEARYNVTTDFPSLGLHSAASTGNVGLVEYALSRGQPVNSVVDGVLPLHAACAGGNVQVVKLLIEYGADVNAPRLPKRYSNRDSSAPIIGTTGSTPLHFAAANGNRDAIWLLLLHGAHADRADKHGVTPENLARQSGWIECADLLKEWIINKDKDLREREEFIAADDKNHAKRRNRLGSFDDPEPSPTPRRRLHVKHSIDTALNMLRSSSSNLSEAYYHGAHTPTPPTSPSRPFGDVTSHHGSSNNDQLDEQSIRRPSLSHIGQSDSLPRPRKSSAQSANPHRPRSAGEGAEENGPVPPYAKGGTARRLGSKVSLLNLFRKGQSSEGTGTPDPNTNTIATVTDASNVSISPPSCSLHRSRPHQSSDASIRSRKPGDPSLERKPSLGSPSRSPVPMAIDLHNALAQEQQRINNRDRSKSNASSRYEYLNDDPAISGGGSYNSPGSSPLARLGVLRNQGHHRTRSGSGSSLGHDLNAPSRLGAGLGATVDDAPNNNRAGGTGTDVDNLSRSLPRPGILRPHNRNGSNGQGHMTPSALRALSRDAASHSPSPRGTPARLKSSNSVGSLVRSDSYPRKRTSLRPGSAGSTSGSKQNDDEGGAPIEEEGEGDGEEDEYGKPIEGTETSLLIGVGRSASSSRASLSPIISNDHCSGEGEDALTAAFPFSINRPPPMPTEGDNDDTGAPLVPPPTRVSAVTDNRHRGDSLSSVGTTDSQGFSRTSSTASTMMVATPLMSSEVPPPSDKKEEVLVSGAEVVDTEDEDQRSHYVVISPATDASPSPPPISQSHSRRPPPLLLRPSSDQAHMHRESASSLALPSTMHLNTGSMNGRRMHTPFEIDIASISTHAQAEALVEKARKEVLELASLEDQDIVSAAGSDGRTPLSARLAAYGESLALERRLRESEQGGGSAASGVTVSTMLTSENKSAISGGTSSTNLVLPLANQHSRDGSGYASSLYSTGGFRDAPSPRSVNGVKNSARVKRPSTAEGLAPRDMNLSLSSEQSDQSFLSGRSASALGHQRSDATPYGQFPIPTVNVSSSSNADDDHVYHKTSPSQGYLGRSRASTADHENGTETNPSISRMASLDGIEYDDDDFGSPLYRVSTAPSPVPRLPPAQAQGRSAKKLSKMGISVADQAGRGALPPLAPVHGGKKFSAFKSFFKGGKS